MDIEQAHNLSLEEMGKQSFLHPYTALKPHLENRPNIIAHGYTYTAHPVAAAAAMANLDITERLDLPAKCAAVGGCFQRRLREVAGDHPLVGEARGEALAIFKRALDRLTDELVKAGTWKP